MSTPPTPPPQRAPGSRLILVGGILFLAAPPLGLFGTVLGMMGSFRTLSDSGVTDPEALSSRISLTLLATFAGIALGIVGLILALTGLLQRHRRPTPPPPLP